MTVFPLAQLSSIRHKTCVCDITCFVCLAIGLENTHARAHTHKKKIWRIQKHGLITLLASESALAVFAKDVSHDKKLILCLRCNVSLLF